MKLRLPSLLLLLPCLTLQAQWDLSVPLVLEGADEGGRRVEGAANPQETTDAVTLDALRNPTAVFGMATGTNALLVELVPAPPAHTPGMVVTFVPEAHNTGPVTLELGGLGPVPVVKAVDQPFDSADLKPGVPVKVGYDGQVFQVLSQLRQPCPAGTMAISYEVCIDTTAGIPRNFYSANLNCGGRNGRLCTFAEWVTACVMPGGIQSTVLDFEWVDHAANDANLAKRVGWHPVEDVQDCQAGSHRTPTGLALHRCCFDR
jgi:hypothetical protein